MLQAAILESLNITDAQMAELTAAFNGRVEFNFYERTTNKETLKKELQGKDIAIIANMKLDGEVINSAAQLKYLNIAFTGVDHVDLAACKRQNIAVSNASGYATEAVAELTLAMTISLLRQTGENENLLRSLRGRLPVAGTEIKGKTVGIVGLGKIGLCVAEIFHALGANVLALSRSRHKDVPAYIEQTCHDNLWKNADIISLHCPLNDSSRNLVNAATLALCKPTAVIINTARGPVVNTNEMAESLCRGQIAGYAADVYDTEPPLTSDNPLFSAPNTLLLPHIGFFSKEAMTARAKIVFANLSAYLQGEILNKVEL